MRYQDGSYFLDFVSWSSVREAVARVNLPLAQLLEGCAPGAPPLLRVHYPFGFAPVEGGEFFLPGMLGRPTVWRGASQTIRHALNYPWRALPIGLLLSGIAEGVWCSDQPVPVMVFEPGSMCGFVDPGHRYRYDHFGSHWMVTSGLRSLFNLANTKDAERFRRLRHYFGLRAIIPRGLQDHWQVFKGIYESRQCGDGWHSQWLFLPRRWVKYLLSRRTTSNYIYRLLAKQGQGHSTRRIFDLLWQGFVYKSREQGYRLQGFIYDWAKQLILVGLGEEYAFVPATSDGLVPKVTLCHAYEKIYRTRHYPGLMHIKQLRWAQGPQRVYCSLQFPLHLPTVVQRQGYSSMDDLYAIKRLLEQFYHYVHKGVGALSHVSYFRELVKSVVFKYYHRDKDPLREIHASCDIIRDDERFLPPDGQAHRVAINSSFFKGCVQVSYRC